MERKQQEMKIKQLIEKYKENRDSYLKTAYNETQLRADFLDPFFELLGWDIKNEQGKPTNEREVLLEEALKPDANSNTKKPDYTFRLFSERKFFLEAKKPSVKIDTDEKPAQQVRRYGFTAKLKISVLSNFEYLAIYDCSKHVSPSDSVTKSRVKIYHYKEYEKCFDEIHKYLSHESVYSGEFDEAWIHIEEQLKLSSVDSLFLEQINEWRVVLGKEIYTHSTSITEEELNDTVQSYINSLIFLRVCEDRNLETYKSLLKFATEEDFEALISKFKEADKKYNSGLFDHTLTREIISKNYSAFWLIINKLYFPESTYSFSVFSSDILGSIYEIFLGDQLVISNDDDVILERKPENSGDDRSIVATPIFIIKDILRNTVVEFCKNKNDTEILSSSFADISCGSGAFLLETYQLINDILIDYYIKTNKSTLTPTGVNTFKLPFSIKKEVLENCIFGVDKDFSAVEACKFGLLLKLLEGEDSSTITVPALPSLDGNISFGNSLIDTYDDEEHYSEVNPFNFNDTKYDLIVGNPPYMATEHMKQFTPLELPLYKEIYEVSHKQFDKYFLFIERGLSLLKEDGYLGYIIPSKFIKVGAGKKLRKLLTENGIINKIISFGANQVFYQKNTYTCLLILRKKAHQYLEYTEIHSLKEWKTRNYSDDLFEKIRMDTLENTVWEIVPNHLKPAFNKIIYQSKQLSEIVGEKNIYNGIQTSANNIYVHSADKQDDDFIYFTYKGTSRKIEKAVTRPYFRTSNGTDKLNTYRLLSPNSFVIYPYKKSDKGIDFIEIDDMEADYPLLFKYLQYYESKLNSPSRSIKPTPESDQEWYRYGRQQSLDACTVPSKIVVGILSNGNKYAIDYTGTFIASGGTAGYCAINVPESCEYSIYYIQALLNSRYLEWCVSMTGEVFRGNYIARGTKVLKNLPVRTIDFSNKTDKELHDEISEIQKSLISIKASIDKSLSSKRDLLKLHSRFHFLKTQLDSTLKLLYNLGEDEDLVPSIKEIYETN